MEWSPALKPYDLLPKSLGGTADVPSATKAVADATKSSAATSDDLDSMWHISFDDVLDVVNPLQHFPIVGTVYRALTHDQIKTPEKIAGDTLYGGVMGLASFGRRCRVRITHRPQFRRHGVGAFHGPLQR